MYLTQFDPWKRNLSSDVFKMLEKMNSRDNDDQSDVVTSDWAPRVDIKEEKERFVLKADIPGVDPKDIEVSMEKGVLTVKGERTFEDTNETDNYTRIERTHGVFYRRFALPDSADGQNITAKGEHGVLEIIIPKRPEAKAHRIEVQ